MYEVKPFGYWILFTIAIYPGLLISELYIYACDYMDVVYRNKEKEISVLVEFFYQKHIILDIEPHVEVHKFLSNASSNLN